MDTRLPSKFVHTAFAAAIVSLLSEGAGAQQCALPQNCAPTTGNVGIGTTNPETKLHVLGPGGGRAVATFEQPTGINYVDLRASATGGQFGTDLRFFANWAFNQMPTAEIKSTPNGQLRFATFNLATLSDTDRVVIDSVGNVGIGTVNPGRTLDVEGPIVAANGSSACCRCGGSGEPLDKR